MAEKYETEIKLSDNKALEVVSNSVTDVDTNKVRKRFMMLVILLVSNINLLENCEIRILKLFLMTKQWIIYDNNHSGHCSYVNKLYVFLEAWR